MPTENSEVPENINNNWKKINIETMKVKLDPNNPRLDLDENADQEVIRKALFDHEDIIGLIDSITENGGLFPGENIIVLNKDTNYIVLEGNRRVCAIQCMINPNLAPIKYRDEIKNLIRDFNINKLNNLEVDVAPSWEAAQKIITSRHTEYQIKKWSYISKWRRDYKEFLKTGNTHKVSQIFGEDENQVIKNLHNYAFIIYILNMPIWTEIERNKLSSNDLKASLLEREMPKDVENVLGITFDPKNHSLLTSMDREKFNYVLTKFIRSLFLDGTPQITTRTNREIVKKYVNDWIKEYEDGHEDLKLKLNDDMTKNQIQNKSKLKEKTNNKLPRPHPKYFRKLLVAKNLNDENLEHVVYEISKIQVEKFPLATLLLTRTLIEKSLIYRLKFKNIWRTFMEDMKKKYGENNYKSSFKLDDLVRYCINNNDKLFEDPKISVDAKKALEAINSNSIRKYLNDMVHESLRNGSPESVENIADNIRGLIQKILSNEN